MMFYSLTPPPSLSHQALGVLVGSIDGEFVRIESKKKEDLHVCGGPTLAGRNARSHEDARV